MPWTAAAVDDAPLARRSAAFVGLCSELDLSAISAAGESAVVVQFLRHRQRLLGSKTAITRLFEWQTGCWGISCNARKGRSDMSEAE